MITVSQIKRINEIQKTHPSAQDETSYAASVVLSSVTSKLFVHRDPQTLILAPHNVIKVVTELAKAGYVVEDHGDMVVTVSIPD